MLQRVTGQGLLNASGKRKQVVTYHGRKVGELLERMLEEIEFAAQFNNRDELNKALKTYRAEYGKLKRELMLA